MSPILEYVHSSTDQEQWREDDAKNVDSELVAIDKDRDESMEFDDPEEQLTVNLRNLVGDASS